MSTTHLNATDLTLLEQEQKPSEKALEALKEWRNTTENQFKAELIDAVIKKLEVEVA